MANKIPGSVELSDMANRIYGTDMFNDAVGNAGVLARRAGQQFVDIGSDVLGGMRDVYGRGVNQNAGAGAGPSAGAGGVTYGGMQPAGGSSGPRSADIYSKMLDILGQMSGHTPTNSADVYRELSSRVGNFRPQYEEMRRTQAQAYAAPTEVMQDYYNKFGGEAGVGPGALTQLNRALQTVGNRFGTAGLMGDLISQQRGRLEDLARSALEQRQNELGALQNLYGMYTPLYQTAVSQEEAARERAAAASRAAAQLQAQREQQQLQREFMERQLQAQLDMAQTQYGSPEDLVIDTGDTAGGGGGLMNTLGRYVSPYGEGWGTVLGGDTSLGNRALALAEMSSPYGVARGVGSALGVDLPAIYSTGTGSQSAAGNFLSKLGR